MKPNKKREPVIYNVIHGRLWKTLTNYNFVILPIGAFYHKGITEARPGDRIRFEGGDERDIIDICKLEIHSSLFRNLCRMRYGVETELVIKQWRRTAIGIGFSPAAIDWNKCVLVWYKENESKSLSKSL